MVASGRGNIEARLVEMERQRDKVIDRLVDRYIARSVEIVRGRYDLEERAELKACLDTGDPLPDEVQAVIMADPEVQSINAFYWRLARWKDSAEECNPHTRRRK